MKPTAKAITLEDMARAWLDALPDDVLDQLAARVAQRGAQPVAFSAEAAANYLGVSVATLRRLDTIEPVRIEGCTKPLWRRTDLDRLIAREKMVTAGTRDRGQGTR